MSKSPFQLQLEQDEDAVFFNLAEFACKVIWNGDEIVVVEDEGLDAVDPEGVGSDAERRKYRVKRRDFKGFPRAGDPVVLDGEEWRVEKAEEWVGAITLVRGVT